MIERIMLIIVEEQVVTKITPSAMAMEFLTLLVTASEEQMPSIIANSALFFQNPS